MTNPFLQLLLMTILTIGNGIITLIKYCGYLLIFLSLPVVFIHLMLKRG